MHFQQIAASLALTATLASAGPIQIRQDGPGHEYTCDPSAGAAGKKGSLTGSGADVNDLAMTILETSCNMDGTSYPYGDVLPDGTPKTGDSANFGLFKNNWYMLRTYCSKFAGQGEGDWNNGAVLNTDPASTIACQHEMIQKLGRDEFNVQHRGAGGAAGGQDYGNAVQFIVDFLNQGHMSDDEVTYYNLHPV